MLWVPSKGLSPLVYQSADVAGANYGITVTTGASASTKGTPAQFTAGLDYDVHWVTVVASGYAANATNSKCCLDLLVGAATEEVAVANMLAGHAGGGTGGVNDAAPKTWDFPLFIPANTRIALQAAGDRTSTAIYVNLFLHSFPVPPCRVAGSVTTYGVSSVPAGTAVTAGVSGAEGSWVEITSSTTRDHFAIVPSLQGPTDTTFQTSRMLVAEFAIGAAGAEEPLAGGNHQFTFRIGDGDESIEGPQGSPWPLFSPIPSGSRLSCRISNSGVADAAAPEVAIHALS